MNKDKILFLGDDRLNIINEKQNDGSGTKRNIT